MDKDQMTPRRNLPNFNATAERNLTVQKCEGRFQKGRRTWRVKRS